MKMAGHVHRARFCTRDLFRNELGCCVHVFKQEHVLLGQRQNLEMFAILRSLGIKGLPKAEPMDGMLDTRRMAVPVKQDVALACPGRLNLWASLLVPLCSPSRLDIPGREGNSFATALAQWQATWV